jgi:chemotaxis protein methyltransferase CheR
LSGTEQDMPEALALELAARRVEAEIGLKFSGARSRQFEAALGRMATALGHASAHACAAWLLSGTWDNARSDLCARFLTIGETYFFREPRALGLVCERARAHLAGGEPRPLRIWSAGCCTGEEPYSIAMALRRRVPQLPPNMVGILATDLNQAFLDFARAGRYRRWSFRRTGPAEQQAFFRALDDGRFEIDPALRAQIRFARLNLAGTGFPSVATGTVGMDVIFCRNVLMYFGRDKVKAVVARLRDCLVDGGWLVVNASEASSELFSGFTPVYHEDAVYFQKCAAPLPAAAALLPRAPRAQASAEWRPQAAQEAPAHASAQDDAVMARVRSLVAVGARDEALQCLRRAVEADARSVTLQQDAALFAMEHGDRVLARHGVKRLLYLDPDSMMGHYLSALIEDADGQRAQALRLLHECRRLASSGASVDEELSGAVEQWLERLQ